MIDSLNSHLLAPRGYTHTGHYHYHYTKQKKRLPFSRFPKLFDHTKVVPT
jgi:hypothetical protein